MKCKVLYTCMLLAALGVTSACGGGDATEPRTPSATGTWLGNAITDFGADRFITLSLEENGQTISGSAEITTALGEPPYYTGSVSGSHAHPDVSLVITAPEFAPLSLVGTFADANTVNVILSGTAGWTNTPVTLRRQ